MTEQAGLSSGIEAVLDALAHRMDGDAEWRAMLDGHLEQVRGAIQSRLKDDWIVKWSSGQGNVAQVPWVVVLRPGQTPQRGLFPDLLFAKDGSAAFLSLNQGTAGRAKAEVQAVAAELRRQVGEAPGRFLREDLDLRGSTSLPQTYALANVAAVRYTADEVPEDQVIEEDLRVLIDLVAAIEPASINVNETSASATTTWIFQSSPAQYDLEAALAELTEFTWLVNQYPKQIHTAHRVYLWEVGPGAGVVARARVLSEPTLLEEPPAEYRFWRRPGADTGPKLRVRLAIEDVIKPRLLRATIADDPTLAGLPNLKFANATNFPMTPEQVTAMDNLLTAQSAPRVPPIDLGLQPEDFDVLVRNSSLANFSSISEQDRSQIHALRARLLTYATSLAQDVGAAIPLRAFASHPSPSGRVSRIYWSCAFPAAVSDKSYAYQLFVIVSADHVEFGLGSGAARSPFRTGPIPDDSISALARARASLRALVGTNLLKGVGDAASALGFRFRQGWDGNPDATGFSTIDEWAGHAASDEGGGAAISRFLTRDEALAVGDGFYPMLRRELATFVPVFDATYAVSTIGVIGDTSALGLPAGFRFDLFDAAVAELKRDRARHGDLHRLSCRQLAAWIERRGELPDEELWAGLRDRFLPFGHVTLDGERYRESSELRLTEAELREAEAEGRVEAHGNLHWTNLARSPGSDRDDIPAIRAAIDWLLDETVPFSDRIAALVGGPRRVKGFGVAIWAGLYAMVRGWTQPTYNGTVGGAFERLNWRLTAEGPAHLVAEVRTRGEKLMAYSGMSSLADLDWVYWRVLQTPATPAWIPNARFDADAERFRAFRQTPDYVTEEVEYKAALQAVLRHALSPELLARSDIGAFFQRVIDRGVDADELGLTPSERQAFERWNYKQTWVNLNGSPMAASAIMGALHAWAGSEAEAAIREVMGDLVHGHDPAPVRIERFCTRLSAAFKDLHTAGRLKSASAPRMSLTFAASILGLVDADHCTLWRSDVYRRAADDFELVLPNEGATAADKYAASIAMQTTIRDALRNKGMDIRDLLEVHDFLWVRVKTWPEGGEVVIPPPDTSWKDEGLVPSILQKMAASAGLWFEPWVAEDLYLSLRTKPFLILTGLSGTGKTKVALALQDLLADADTRAFVSVRPDWVDGKSLLGYHNLLTDTFVTTPTTRLLLAAEAEYATKGTAARPFLLLLDEMNLARVEHYLADYLSVLESRRLGPDGGLVSDPISLHAMGGPLPAAGGGGLVPPVVCLAPNVYVIGTVNIDETTHPFSRKVLDRANVVELFDVDLARSGQASPAAITDLERRRVQAHFTRGGAFVDLAEPSLDTTWLVELIAVNAVLARDRMHFGYRVRNEALAFVEQAGGGGLFGEGMEAKRIAFDLQLLQKVLPKLAGSRERLERPLRGLLSVCLFPTALVDDRVRRLADDPERLFTSMEAIAGGDGWSAVEQMQKVSTEPSVPALPLSGEAADTDVLIESPASADGARPNPWPLRGNEVRYPRTARKIARMLLQLRDEGYTSFFE